MGKHSPAVAQLDQWEADRARRRALELVAELDGLTEWSQLLAWAGAASVILKELARG